MNQQIRRRLRPLTLAFAVPIVVMAEVRLCHAQATADMVPLLSLGGNQKSIPSQVVVPENSQSEGQGIGGLERSLKQLAGGSNGRGIEKRRVVPKDRIYSALLRLSKKGTQDKAATVGPRLTDRVDRQSTHDDVAAAMASIAENLMMASRNLASYKTTRQGMVDTDALHRALNRFDSAAEPVASKTFSRVFLGLSEMVPKLSGRPMRHPRVDKSDLRADVIDSRTAAASFDTPMLVDMPALNQSQVAIVQPLIDAAVDAGSAQIADLSGPIGQIELAGMSAAPRRQWADAMPEEEQYAVDELDLDELDGAMLAGLDSPVEADQLQETRAGFVLNNGVQIDFAVTRLSSVDGLDRLHAITPLPQGLDAAALGQISAIRSGNARVLSPSDGSVFTVIQNGLDNQRILDVTAIQVDIKNFGLRSMDFVPSSLRSGAIPPELR